MRENLNINHRLSFHIKGKLFKIFFKRKFTKYLLNEIRAKINIRKKILKN